MWSSLSREVAEAPSINSFNNHLDKYWSDQDIHIVFKDLETVAANSINILKGTVHPQKIFVKYVMLRTVAKNSTIIITKYT